MKRATKKRAPSPVYVICTRWPDKPIEINEVGKAKMISLLVSSIGVKNTIKGGKLTIVPPAINPGNQPCNYAWVFKVENGNVPRN